MSYVDTCPQRAVVTVHHTIATWLPVALDCGHVEQINWTAKVGDKIGCTTCKREDDTLKNNVKVTKVKTGVCVMRDLLSYETGKLTTGVFEWAGPNWHVADIIGLLKELPRDVSDKELRAAYRAAKKTYVSREVDWFTPRVNKIKIKLYIVKKRV